jgi:hypothetical protein
MTKLWKLTEISSKGQTWKSLLKLCSSTLYKADFPPDWSIFFLPFYTSLILTVYLALAITIALVLIRSNSNSNKHTYTHSYTHTTHILLLIHIDIPVFVCILIRTTSFYTFVFNSTRHTHIH